MWSPCTWPPTPTRMLRPNLEKYLKPGSRVVSHDYAVPGWKPKLVDKDPEAHGHTIYLYEMPPR